MAVKWGCSIEAIARGVRDGILAYVGKIGNAKL